MMLPRGMIMNWSGSIATIPTGFVLCNGANGTPDLRNRFVVGAGDTYAVDDTGGNADHTHTFTSDGHAHSIPAGSGIQAGANFLAGTSGEVDTGTTFEAEHIPFFYALAFIMKT